jgi:hypothetical protein
MSAQWISLAGGGDAGRVSCMQAAIKFYLCREAFDGEKALYMKAQLRKMMPATLAIEDNAGGEWRTPYGFAFPPFFIIERGQSLDEWAHDNKFDFITVFQACPPCMHAPHAYAAS